MGYYADLAVIERPMAVTPPFPDPLGSHLAGLGRQTAYLDFRYDGPDDPLATKLLGQPYLEEGEEWPRCQHCGGMMHHLFQLNFQAVGHLVLRDTPLLSFFFCLACHPEDHRQPGWRVLQRKALHPDRIACHPRPPVPPQQEQALPIGLLGDLVAEGAVRIAADLPSNLDDAVRDWLVLGGEPGDHDFAGAGADRIFTVTLRKRGSGDTEILRGGLTPGTDPDTLVRELAKEHLVERVEIRPLRLGQDYRDAYIRYLRALRGGWQIASKIGGWLDDLQPQADYRCQCGAPLAHVATIAADDSRSPFVVGNGGALYLAACTRRDCPHGDLVWWCNWT